MTCLEVFERLVSALGERRARSRRGGRPPRESRPEGDDDYGTAGPLPAEVVAAIRRIVEKWPPPPDALRGRSLADVLEEQETRPATPGERVLAAVRRALDDAADGRAAPGRREAAGRVPALVPLPSPRDRRATVARLVGTPPLLYAGEVESPRARASGRTHVYLDVSGSMDPYLPFLYGALVRLGERVDPRVRLFSTEVVTVRLEALARGKVPTTGGTEGACVFEHALAAGVRRILVITDGYVGETKARLARGSESPGSTSASC